MDGFSCNNCGAPMRDNDVFCRKCGSKRQIAGSEYEAGFCAKCGNALRQGAKFCDMCGAECDGGGAPRLWRCERKGISPKIFLLVLLLSGVLCAVAVVCWRSGLFQALGGRMPGAAAPNGEMVSPAVPTAPGAGSRSEAPELSAGVPSAGIIPAAPEYPDATVSPAPALPDLPSLPGPDSPDAAVSPAPAAPGSDAAPVPASEQGEPAVQEPEAAEIVWTAQDSDGYSFLTLSDRFVSLDEVLSLPGVVFGGNVNVRSRPSVRGRALRQLDSGVNVDVTGRFASGSESYYWFRIRSADGEIGWIYGQFLRVKSAGSAISAAPAPHSVDVSEQPAAPPRNAPAAIRTNP